MKKHDGIAHPNYEQLATEPKKKLPSKIGTYHPIPGPFIHPFYYTKQNPQPEPKNT